MYPGGVSPYGCLDMSGNVWEWCSDWFDEDYYKSGPDRNPQGVDTGALRVYRGGGWGYNAGDCRVSYRLWDVPQRRNRYLGVRLVRS